MKKQLVIGLFSSLVVVYACKEKKTETGTTTPDAPTTTQPTTDATTNSAAPASGTNFYTVTATPDTARLGKNQEAFVRIVDLKAVALTDPDGKSAGTELTYKLELTNKLAIGGDEIGIGTTDFRLELDNGTKIAPSSVYVSAAPEATKTSGEDRFTIPAGAKPTMLNLFLNQTRASIKIEMK